MIVPAALSTSAMVSGMRSAPGPAPDDDELPGLADLGDPGSLDDEAGDVGRQLGPGDYRVHFSPAGLLLRNVACSSMNYLNHARDAPRATRPICPNSGAEGHM